MDLINQDRRQANIPLVEWDERAAQAGEAHAQEMATFGYISHWNLQGYGPDVRYSLAGGMDTVMENVYLYSHCYSDGRPVPMDDWAELIREAQSSLMASPGHRANILDVAHTHVGVGLVYNPRSGSVYIAQEFINRYIKFEPLQQQARIGSMLTVTGELLLTATSPLINLAYEPFPLPLMVDDLSQKMPSTYASPAKIFNALTPTVNHKQFTGQLRLDYQNQPGLYHARIWVKVNGQNVNVADIVIKVQ
jgi:hypothetical protein